MNVVLRVLLELLDPCGQIDRRNCLPWALRDVPVEYHNFPRKTRIVALLTIDFFVGTYILLVITQNFIMASTNRLAVPLAFMLFFEPCAALVSPTAQTARFDRRIHNSVVSNFIGSCISLPEEHLFPKIWAFT